MDNLNAFGGTNDYTAVAIDTNNCSTEANCNVYVVSKNGSLNARISGSWFGSNNENNNRIATDVPWLRGPMKTICPQGTWRLIHLARASLYSLRGLVFGIRLPAPTSNATNINWTSITGGGIENLVSDTGISIPGHNPIFGFQDRPQFAVTPGTYPSTHGCVTPQGTALTDGWWQDFAAATPSTIVALCNNPPELSGISTDAGSTYTAFASTSYFNSGTNWGGCIASNDATNILILNQAGGVWFSTNGGGSWANPNVGSLGGTGWGGGFSFNGYPKRCE